MKVLWNELEIVYIYLLVQIWNRIGTEHEKEIAINQWIKFNFFSISDHRREFLT